VRGEEVQEGTKGIVAMAGMVVAVAMTGAGVADAGMAVAGVGVGVACVGVPAAGGAMVVTSGFVAVPVAVVVLLRHGTLLSSVARMRWSGAICNHVRAQ
jgi:hypothetical protein